MLGRHLFGDRRVGGVCRNPPDQLCPTGSDSQTCHSQSCFQNSCRTYSEYQCYCNGKWIVKTQCAIQQVIFFQDNIFITIATSQRPKNVTITSVHRREKLILVKTN